MPRTKTSEREVIPHQIRQDIFLSCRGRCQHCGKSVSIRSTDCTIEHVIPLNKGGTNDAKTLTILCKRCNEEKSDDIIPPEVYYPYMEETKRAELQAIFDEYLETYDYLSYDTLFPLDWFDMRVRIPVAVPRTNKIQFVPTTIQVKKSRPWRTLEWLFPYTGRLHTRDKPLIATEEHQLSTPYYMAYYKDKPIVLFSPYIIKTKAETAIRKDGASRNVLFFDMFVHPDIPPVQGKIDFVLATIYEIEKRIQHGLCEHSPDTLIEYVIRTPGSDKAATAVLQRMNQVTPNRIPFTGESEDGSEIRCINALFFQGSIADVRKVGQELGLEETENGFPVVRVDRIDDAQRPLDEVLDQSKEITSWTPPKQITKKEKKAKHKKQKRRR